MDGTGSRSVGGFVARRTGPLRLEPVRASPHTSPLATVQALRRVEWDSRIQHLDHRLSEGPTCAGAPSVCRMVRGRERRQRGFQARARRATQQAAGDMHGAALARSRMGANHPMSRRNAERITQPACHREATPCPGNARSGAWKACLGRHNAAGAPVGRGRNTQSESHGGFRVAGRPVSGLGWY